MPTFSSLSLAALCFAIVVSKCAGQSLSNNLTSHLNYKPPEGWHVKFPYYISGFDQAGRPVLVWDYGKWDVRGTFTESPESAKTLEDYFDLYGQTAATLGTMFEDGITQIVDFGGFSLWQMAHFDTTRLILRLARFAPDWEVGINHGYVVNANFAVQQFLALVAPLMKQVLAKAEVFGTNKERWIPTLLADIPKSQLPKWYGGSKNWKPLQVLGKGEPIDVDMLRKAREKFESENNIVE